MTYNLHELFALPIGLKQVATINEIPLYGSTTLNDKFIEAIKMSKRGNQISKEIIKLVNNNLIVPCFADNNILTYFRRKISKDNSGGLLRIFRILVSGKKPITHPLDFILAFYDFNSNKIIILISNHINETFSSTASDESISLSLTHEMMHMYAHQKPYEFLNLFKDELNSYYKTYFTKIFKLNDDKTLNIIINQIYRFLFLKNEMNDSNKIYITSIIKQLEKLRKFSTFNDDKFNKVISDYIKIVWLYYNKDFSSFISLVKDNYKYLILPLYSSYKESFGKIPNKGALQELIIPSEVICGYSDLKLDSKVKKALQSI